MSASSASAGSLLGESLVFRFFGTDRFGSEILIETAAFEVGAEVEYSPANALMHIDVSDAAITLQVAESLVGLFAFIQGSIFEFEIVSDQRFASAEFDVDASTCCVVQPESLSASRVDVQPTHLRIDMGGLGGASGQTIVTAVQTVPEPRTATLIAVGLLLLSVRARPARRPTRRCS